MRHIQYLRSQIFRIFFEFSWKDLVSPEESFRFLSLYVNSVHFSVRDSQLTCEGYLDAVDI